jgi:small GTP-binding protein
MPPKRYILKICLLGDGAVGKTSLVRRYVFDVFNDKYLTSFGTKVSKKSVEIGDAKVDLMIWDILGQKTYETLHQAYYRGAAGALVVCDLTRPETIESLVGWLESFRQVAGGVPVLLLANKADLDRKIDAERLEEFGRSQGCDLLETSAKTGQNVEEAFLNLGGKLLEAP